MTVAAITLTHTSKGGTIRIVEAEFQHGKVVAVFKRQTPWERSRTSKLPVNGTLESLENFATKQPGMFCKWVDAKFGM